MPAPSSSPFSIGLARPADFERLMTIMDEANRYASERSGEPIWTALAHSRAQLRKQLGRSSCYVLRTPRGEVVASISLAGKGSAMWGEAAEDGRALYMYKLMKDPLSAPPNAGLRLIAFAAEEVLRREKTWLRCDTKTNQVRLIAYYERLGFAKKGLGRYTATGREAVLLEAEPKALLARVAKVLS